MGLSENKTAFGVGLAVPGRWVGREDLAVSVDEAAHSWLRQLDGADHVLITDKWTRSGDEPGGEGDGIAPVVTAALAALRPPFQLLTEMSVHRYLPIHVARYAADLWQLTGRRWGLVLVTEPESCDERRGSIPAAAPIDDVVRSVRQLWSGDADVSGPDRSSDRAMVRPRPGATDQPPILVQVDAADGATAKMPTDVEWLAMSPHSSVSTTDGVRVLLRYDGTHDTTSVDAVDAVRSTGAQAVTLTLPSTDRDEAAELFGRLAPHFREALVDAQGGPS